MCRSLVRFQDLKTALREAMEGMDSMDSMDGMDRSLDSDYARM